MTHRACRSRARAGHLTATGPVTPTRLRDRWGRAEAKWTALGEALVLRRRTRVRFPPPPPWGSPRNLDSFPRIRRSERTSSSAVWARSDDRAHTRVCARRQCRRADHARELYSGGADLRQQALRTVGCAGPGLRLLGQDARE